MSIADEIRRVRKTKGLTQSELAALIGRTQVSIARYETEKEEPPIRTLKKIADVLGCDLSIQFVSVTDNVENV